MCSKKFCCCLERKPAIEKIRILSYIRNAISFLIILIALPNEHLTAINLITIGADFILIVGDIYFSVKLSRCLSTKRYSALLFWLLWNLIEMVFYIIVILISYKTILNHAVYHKINGFWILGVLIIALGFYGYCCVYVLMTYKIMKAKRKKYEFNLDLLELYSTIICDANGDAIVLDKNAEVIDFIQGQ